MRPHAFDDTHVMVAPWQALQLAQALPTGSTLQAVDAGPWPTSSVTCAGRRPSSDAPMASACWRRRWRFGAWGLRQDGAARPAVRPRVKVTSSGSTTCSPRPRLATGAWRAACAPNCCAMQAAKAPERPTCRSTPPICRARAVYARLGFVDGYHYHYRTADPDAA